MILTVGELLVWTAGSAVLASVWHYVLTMPGHLFFGVRKHGDAIEARLRARWLNRWPWLLWLKVTRSLLVCSYCLAGQLGLVTYLVRYGVHCWSDVWGAAIFTALSIYIETWSSKHLKQGRPAAAFTRPS